MAYRKCSRTGPRWKWDIFQRNLQLVYIELLYNNSILKVAEYNILERSRREKFHLVPSLPESTRGIPTSSRLSCAASGPSVSRSRRPAAALYPSAALRCTREVRGVPRSHRPAAPPNRFSLASDSTPHPSAALRCTPPLSLHRYAPADLEPAGRCVPRSRRPAAPSQSFPPTSAVLPSLPSTTPLRRISGS